MTGKRRHDLQAHRFSWSACDGQWTLIGHGARAVSMEGEGVPLETAGVPGSSRHRLDYLQDQRELQHNYYDREASSGFAGCGGLLVFMVGMRWPVNSDWTRGQSRRVSIILAIWMYFVFKYCQYISFGYCSHHSPGNFRAQIHKLRKANK